MPTPIGIASIVGTYDGTTVPTITFKEILGSSATARKIQANKLDFKPDATILDLNNGNGVPSGFNKIRGIWTLSGEFVVRADTVANSRLSLRPPVDMSSIVLAHYIADADAFLNGTWLYKTGGTCGISDEGEAKINIEMMRYFDGSGTEVSVASLLTVIS